MGNMPDAAATLFDDRSQLSSGKLSGFIAQWGKELSLIRSECYRFKLYVRTGHLSPATLSGKPAVAESRRQFQTPFPLFDEMALKACLL